MGTYVVKLPDVGEGVAEAEIVEWHVTVGDLVTEDQPIADVMTDKATVELPSPVGGTITRLGAEAGDVVATGSELVWIETDGDIREGATQSEPAVEDKPATAQDRPGSATVVSDGGQAMLSDASRLHHGMLLAAPAVRRRAADLGVDLAAIAGSGPDGRIVHGDLDRLFAERPTVPDADVATPLAVGDDIEVVKIVGLRRNIAQRMEESTRRIAHFTYVEEVDVTDVERLRSELNRRHENTRPRLTMLPLLARAVIEAVGEFPQMNARFKDDDGVVERHRAVHLGIATQTAKGLMVPVVDHAESHDLWALSGEVARLAEAARDGTVALEELHGSTITITSLGALGGVVTTPVINYPEVAIIGVNKIVTRAVFADGAWLPRQVMNLSSSFDHRVIDGWDAAQFIQRIKALIENPALLFID